MSNNNNNSSLGLTLLGIAFVVLKLCKVINWSWLWVTCPFWGRLALLLALFPVYVWYRNSEIDKIEKKIEARKQDRLNNPIPKKSAFMQRLEDAQRQQQEQQKNRKQ